ncbi:MAG TPA: hypothetical protein VN457_05565, partial [Chlamydiales bacterium]|nr:hypothetical protein [Chlamydiales bacterium]
KKFQKAPFKDAQECLKCITQLALAHPDVQFEVISDKKKELNLAQHGLEERVKALLPAEFTSSMKQVSYKTPAIQIEGFVGDVASSRPNRTAQFLFLNRRPIQSLALSFAVKEAYGTLIDKERHPAFVLHIELQGDSVDVNVHPQKKEVRFRREYEIKKTLVEHVSAALFSKASTHKTCSPSLSCIASPVAFSFESPLFFEKSKAMQQSDEIVLPLAFTTFQIVGVWKEYIFAEISFDEAAPQKLQQAGLCIIDAKLALARIAFEDLGAIKETKVHSQILVNPLCIQMALHEAKQLSQLAPSLKNMGFEIREFGTSQFLVEAIPVTLDIVQVESFFHECMAEDGVDPVQQKRVIATAAARFSCLHKNGLTIDLAKEIIRRLLACQMPYQCPQGNAVFAHFTKDRMRKEFQ